MPIRAFITQNQAQLERTLSLLEGALANGSVNELRVAGIMSTTGDVTQEEIQTRYNQVRWELYFRITIPAVKADPAYNPLLPISCQTGLSDPAKSLFLKYTNPYCEAIRRVETVQTGHYLPTGQSIFP